MIEPQVEDALLRGIEALETVGVRYAIVGGLAVSAWAMPRATRDVDLYSELPDATRDELREELEKRGFDVPAMEEELQRFGVFRSRSRSGVFLDIFDAVGPLGDAILDRRKRVTVGERDIWLATAEDLAVLKAYSDRARDFYDLIALLALDNIDQGYVTSWAVRLDESIGGNDVSERIARARAEADLE